MSNYSIRNSWNVIEAQVDSDLAIEASEIQIGDVVSAWATCPENWMSRKYVAIRITACAPYRGQISLLGREIGTNQLWARRCSPDTRFHIPF